LFRQVRSSASSEEANTVIRFSKKEESPAPKPAPATEDNRFERVRKDAAGLRKDAAGPRKKADAAAKRSDDDTLL
jgi:hypothetical protein